MRILATSSALSQVDPLESNIVKSPSCNFKVSSLALVDFNKIIADSNSPDLKSRSIYHRSGAYVRLERYTEAIEDLRALLRTDPNSLQPRILLGKALKMVGEYAKAEESVSQARDLDPKQADIYIERGDIRCRMGSRKKVDEAIQGESCL